jgi:hypothetical protein
MNKIVVKELENIGNTSQQEFQRKLKEFEAREASEVCRIYHLSGKTEILYTNGITKELK